MYNMVFHSLFSLIFTFSLPCLDGKAVFVREEAVCPLCGTAFSGIVMTDAGADEAEVEVRLRSDFRPVGQVVSPRPLLQCPECRFVLFPENDRWSRELEDEERKTVREYLASGDIAPDAPAYFVLARILERLGGEDPETLALFYMMASWQAEGIDIQSGDLRLTLPDRPEQATAALRESLRLLETLCPGLGDKKFTPKQRKDFDFDSLMTDGYLLTEACRRLGDFDRASAAAVTLRAALEVLPESRSMSPTDRNMIRFLIVRQTELSQGKDDSTFDAAMEELLGDE